MGRQFPTTLSVELIASENLTNTDGIAADHNRDAGIELIAGHIVDHSGNLATSTANGLIAKFSDLADSVDCATAIWREFESNNSQSKDRDWRVWIGICDADPGQSENHVEVDGSAVVEQLKARLKPDGIYLATWDTKRIQGSIAPQAKLLASQDIGITDKPIPVFQVTPSMDGIAPGEVTFSRTTSAWKQLTIAACAVLIIAGVAVGTWLWRWQPQSVPLPAGNMPASVEAMELPLPDKPSVAVLPFDHLGAERTERHLGDGLTEDLITSLSQISSLFVVARNSTFVYRGKPVKVQQVAEELGVRYVLEGSIQTSGDQVRITAQLIDALAGTHIWAERYDRELTGLFELQDDITTEIVAALRVNLTQGEEVRVHRRHTNSVDAWNLVGRGMEHFYRSNKADNLAARRYFERAIEIDETYALAHTVLAWTYWFDAFRGYSDDAAKSLETATALAQKALALDDTFPDVHALLGAIHLLKREYNAAIAAARKAVEFNPNHATNTALLAMILHNSGELEEAIATFKRAMRLSPYYPDWFLEELGFTYLDAGRHDEALVALEEYIKRDPASEHMAHARIARALAFHAQGRYEQARAEIVMAKEALPGITIAYFVRHALNEDQSDPQRAAKILRALGLPD